jgi:hypothetical protein
MLLILPAAIRLLLWIGDRAHDAGHALVGPYSRALARRRERQRRAEERAAAKGRGGA